MWLYKRKLYIHVQYAYTEQLVIVNNKKMKMKHYKVHIQIVKDIYI